VKVLKNLNILYVEDEESIIEKYSYFLEESCKELFIARDGEEAYRIYLFLNLVVFNLQKKFVKKMMLYQ